jgi:hypothetical protein
VKNKVIVEIPGIRQLKPNARLGRMERSPLASSRPSLVPRRNFEIVFNIPAVLEQDSGYVSVFRAMCFLVHVPSLDFCRVEIIIRVGNCYQVLLVTTQYM